MNLDYQIAKDYLNKLPLDQRENLCKSVLNVVQQKKKSKKEIDKYYTDFLKKSKTFQDFKKEYGFKK